MRLLILLIFNFLILGCSSTEMIYVGTGSKKDGIFLLQFDKESGKLTKKYHKSDVTRAGFLTISPDKKFLYAVTSGHKIRAYKIEKDFSLTFLNETLSTGEGPCHISTSKNGRAVVVANYRSGGTTAVAIGDDGSLKGEPMAHPHSSFKA